MSPARPRAEPCRYLERGTSTSIGSVKPREKQKAEIVKAEMETFRQIHLPAAAGASLRVSSSVADIRLTIFLPDTAPEIIRQPERLDCTKTIRLPATPDACAV